MKKHNPSVFILFMLFLSSIILAVDYDSGYREFKQPDSTTTFTGREWGDEFFFQRRTQDGYKYVLGADGWYYYALPDDSVGFISSGDTVGINSPPYQSYQLQPPSAYMAKVEEARAEFEEQVEANLQWFMQEQEEARAAEQPVPVKIGILLVEFQDVKHYKSDPPPNGNRQYGYLIEDFEKMFFSRKDNPDTNWYAPHDSMESPHPEGDRVFGSLHDYYWEVSRGAANPSGALWLYGNLINPPDTLHPEVPQWITLSYNKVYYDTSTIGRIIGHGIARAQDKGWLGSDPYADYNKICVIYAGNFLYGGGLNPVAADSAWDMGERSNSDVAFAHIGIHAHEFGHTIGMHHDWNGYYFSVMRGGGATNGPNRRGACPAMINPYYRVEKYEWAASIEVVQDTSDFNVAYDYDDPNYYKITSILDSSKYFYVENRRRTGFDQYTPNNPADTTLQGGWLLIWDTDASRAKPKSQLLAADGFPDSSIACNFFPACTATYQDLNNSTFPSSYISGEPTYIAVNDVRKFTADPRQMIVDISRYDDIITITDQVTWAEDQNINKMIIIEDGGMLTVQPGVNVTMDPVTVPLSFLIKEGGTLIAQGTESSPITIHAKMDTSNKEWQGLIFESGSDFSLSYFNIKNAETGIDFSAVDSSDLSNRQYTGWQFQNCYNAMGPWKANSVVFEELELSNVSQYVLINGEDYAFENCHFSNSYLAIQSNDTLSEVQNCIFDSSSVLFINSSSPEIAYNKFYNDGKISLGVGQAHIHNNIFVGNSQATQAIFLGANSLIKPKIINNTIAFYDFGIYCTASDGGIDAAQPDVFNNILYKNRHTSDEYGTLQGDGTAEFNCFFNIDTTGTPIHYTNIYEDPDFVDTLGFHLKSTSPCIDSGDSTADYSNEPQPNGGRINMGAYGNTPEATLSFDVIAQQDFNENTTWGGYVNVINDISTNQYSLTLEPGTKVLFDDGKTLTINGDFSSDGRPNPQQEPDSIEFRGYRETDEMGGIFIESGDEGNVIAVRYNQFRHGDIGLHLENITDEENLFEHLLFENNNTGLYLSGSDMEITNSTFRKNESGLISDYSNVVASACDFDSNSTQGVYLFHSTFEMNHNMIRNNGFRGVYFQYSSDGHFYDNTVLSNGGGTGGGPTEIRAGLVFYQSEPIISTNFIMQNEASGIFSLSSSYPVMVKEGTNRVSDNGASPEDSPEIMVKDISFPLLDGGHNDITDSTGGYLIFGEEDERDIEIDVTYNYWGTVDAGEIEERIYRPSGFIFEPFDEAPNTEFLESVRTGGGMFETALSAEMDSNYVYAISVYDSIIQLYPESLPAKAALGRIYNLKIKTQEDFETIKAYFDTLSNHSDEALATVAKRLSIRCLTDDEQYQNAIDGHTLWSQTTPYISDSVYSEVDILMNQFKLSGGVLEKAGTSPIEVKQSEISAFREYQRKSEALLNSLFGNQLQKEDQIPLIFQLFQNYPNPFNPVTTIKYQLPKASRIKLEIFNILGQKIKTLVDAQQPSEYYTIQWDGKNSHGIQVASGLYIYRLITEALDGSETFVKSKKMLLIR